MITVETKNSMGAVQISVHGHSSHDVCVAVSALTNALVQFANEYANSSTWVHYHEKRYESGNVEMNIEFDYPMYYFDFWKKINAVLTGYKLYAANFPDDVRYVDAHDFKNKL